MSHVRASKQELKRQRDALARFRRYLPTLQLKQRQLQVEVRRARAAREASSAAAAELRAGLAPWVALLAEPLDLAAHLCLVELRIGRESIAGVEVPAWEGLELRRSVPDLHATPPFLDDALDALARLAELAAELAVLEERELRLGAELRTTTQRVNLFEKVKIPEARQALRKIRIALGDLQAAEVVRGKMAKARSRARAELEAQIPAQIEAQPGEAHA